MFKSSLGGLPGSGMIFWSSSDFNNNIIRIRERNNPTGFLCTKNYPTISLIPPWDELSLVGFRGNFCHGEAEICYLQGPLSSTGDLVSYSSVPEIIHVP